MPDHRDLAPGKSRITDAGDVNVEDLLDRDPVPPNGGLLRASVCGKGVMVTGAGGSIGSELCRQIISLNPKLLVLFEVSEIALYDIQRDLTARIEEINSSCEILPLLGSVQHEKRVAAVFESFDISTVYHAAAYKHVTAVERNMLEGVQNNVIGTLNTARAAAEAGVETFVLISTDKAVSPTSVMGATKRLAELVLQALDDEYDRTQFCMVRFGNVLGSSGSVVPLFCEQIRNGGPVTVTHPDMIRYFMTIPEAAQLVIQAGSMAEGGDVFVLDMGEPVMITDLAARMIKLFGLTVRNDSNPAGDIEIIYSGLRPAEKISEELLIGAEVTKTQHPRIMRARDEYIPYEELRVSIDEISAAFDDFDCARVRELLIELVHGYEPTGGIVDIVWEHRSSVSPDEPPESGKY